MYQSLLPQPKEFKKRDGVFFVGTDLRIELGCNDGRIDRAIRRWREQFIVKRARLAGTGSVQTARPDDVGQARSSQATARITVAVDPPRFDHEQQYRLDVAPDRIVLLGKSPAACFHGLQTLGQLTDVDSGVVECCTIVDWPDFATRGALHDVTRGKVPMSTTLELLADRLAQFKINQLQLYIEHAFAFRFDPDICPPDHGLTPDEIRSLDKFCRERFIDLVPAVATFGHMGRILSLPRYRHLAEIEAELSWEETTWPQRARGLTLNCMDAEAHHLVERMWSDVLDAFSSPIVNLCGDEPRDLGRGKNKTRLAEHGPCEAYLAQLQRTHDFCAAGGRRTQFWSDVLLAHPTLLDRVPKETTILHWGYDDDANYEGTKRFVDAGLTTFVCPGTLGWKRVVNAIDAAERNISRFARTGNRLGAAGLITTDWGDHGHFNSLACSWHGLVLGAVLGWSCDHPTGSVFDERFARAVWDDVDERIVPLLRGASHIAERCETWRMLWMPACSREGEASLPPTDELLASREASAALQEVCRGAMALTDNQTIRDDMKELATAARFTAVISDKLRLVNERTSTPTPTGERPVDRAVLATEMREAAEEYAACWIVRNKPAGLEGIQRALSDAARDVTDGFRKPPDTSASAQRAPNTNNQFA